MTSKDMLSLCLGNLFRRKTRTILAIVGVVIGVCAIVVMLSIGFGLTYGFQEQIESFGNLHTIEVYNYGSAPGSDGKTVELDDSTIDKIAKIKGVTAATPVFNEYLTLGIGHMVCSSSIVGIRPEFMELANYELAEGRLLNEGDTNALVFGNNIPSWFYNPREQMGSSYGEEAGVNVITPDVILTGDWDYGTRYEGTGDIKYEQYKCEGVGVLANANDETAYNVYMNIDRLLVISEEIAKSRGESVTPGAKKTYSQALLYVNDIDMIEGICESIKDSYGFQTYSLNDVLKEMQQMTSLVRGVLGGIGSISLLVAAIGIANTMTMSVYERTKEIGIMKVIGASIRDIKRMFLIEAGMIGFIGGTIGLILSYLISLLMNTVLAPVMGSLIGYASDKMSVIPVWLALASLGFAALVGIISGYFPARRAMNLSALEGLKNE